MAKDQQKEEETPARARRVGNTIFHDPPSNFPAMRNPDSPGGPPDPEPRQR